jgi:hypothetical protein
MLAGKAGSQNKILTRRALTLWPFAPSFWLLGAGYRLLADMGPGGDVLL